VSKQTPEERLSRHLCPVGMHGSLRSSVQQLDGLYGLLGEGSEWTILTCNECGFIAIYDGHKTVPISSSEELERFSAALLALGRDYSEKIEKAKRPICARYDKAAERLLARFLPLQLTLHPEKHTAS